MNENKTGGLETLIGLVGGLVGAGIAVFVAAPIVVAVFRSGAEANERARQEEIKRIEEEQRNNRIVSCSSCGNEYRWGDGLSNYCSCLCKERGSWCSCDNGCGGHFFENEGYCNSDGNFCSYSCWDNYTY